MKTIVTDLDGTLLDNGKLSSRSIEVLKELQKKHRLVLATGRNMESVKYIYQELEMDKYKTGALILLNGLAFYDFKDNEYISLKSFNKKQAKRITKLTYSLFFRTTIVTSKERITMNCLYDKIYYLLRYLIKHKPMEYVHKEIEFPEDIEKIELGGSIFFEFFLSILKNLLRNYQVIRVAKYWIEILPKGINKVNQLKYLVNKYDISLDDLYVFGDGENDIDMLAYTKNSYAPANALDDAKKAAKYECLACAEDGVARIIEKIILF